MRRHGGRLAAGVLMSVGLLATSLVGTAPARTVVRAGGATHAAASTLRFPSIFTLAGSPRWLVYGVNDGSKLVMKARGIAGHTRTIRTELDSNRGADNTASAFSIAGNRLTAVLGYGGSAHTALLWWNLKTHKHGRILSPLSPHNATYVGATPRGWLYGAGRSVKEVLPSRRVITLATGVTGFFAAGTKGVTMTSDMNNAVVTVRYQKWSTPGKTRIVTHLRGPWSCGDSNASYVACAETTRESLQENDGAELSRYAIVPLNGDPIRSTTKCPNGTSPGFANHILDPRAFLIVLPRTIAFPGCGHFEFLSATGQVTGTSTPLEDEYSDPNGAFGALTYTRGNFAAIDTLKPGETKPSVLLRVRPAANNSR